MRAREVQQMHLVIVYQSYPDAPIEKFSFSGGTMIGISKFTKEFVKAICQ